MPLGLLVGYMFHTQLDSAEPISLFYDRLNHSMLPTNIRWLMGYPAGLKLNSNLGAFVGELYLWLLTLWNAHFQITPFLRIGTQLVLVSSVLGLQSFLLTLGLLVRAVTIHMEGFHVLASRLYRSELAILGSLWRLFRGKKWNVLHHRIDSADYSLDQLLFGTVFFAIMIFLLPTVLAYYALFSAFKIVVRVIYALLNLPVAVVAIPRTPPKQVVHLELVERRQDCFVYELKQTNPILGHHFVCLLSEATKLLQYHLGPGFWRDILTGANTVKSK